MPSKIQLDENLWFLYTCLKSSDYKTIDFHAVGDVTGLKSTAARMRYARLRKQIENGTLIGTRGIPFMQPSSKKVSRKRRAEDKKATGKEEAGKSEESESEDDSDDEKPLAKRRGVKTGPEKQEALVSLKPEEDGTSAMQPFQGHERNTSSKHRSGQDDVSQLLHQQQELSEKPVAFGYMAPYQTHFALDLQGQPDQAVNWYMSSLWNSTEGQCARWA
ncbi:hypothetical protein PVAG01_00861 [Phlyctema vagabunda]|uniref:Myb-like DNA-binding domain-containing protein n=1 Tax=Phlyctema vagabunda TaxID=108571 RepID=A0ABR4PVG7_9HELO